MNSSNHTVHSDLVLALNARLLSVEPDAFDGFLREFPRSTILAWTGSGEPSVSQELIDKICVHFIAEGMIERIDFDCAVLCPAPKTKNAIAIPVPSPLDMPSPFLLATGGLLVGIAIGMALGKRMH